MQENPKQGAREKVLQAAEELALEVGPANLSLDAVAARAGVSKGGLLYHFPSKARLLEALVEDFVRRFEQSLEARMARSESAGENAATAFLELFVQEYLVKRPPPGGLLAAMAENPDFLRPVRSHQRHVLDRVKESATNPVDGLIVFLTLQGIKSQQLFSMEILAPEEVEAVIGRLRAMIAP